jgi:outer membrane receptor protein involved in Fe transport
MAIFLNLQVAVLTFFDGVIIRGRATGQIPNPNLKWEEAKKLDIGLDMNMFNNKLTLVADYFIDTRLI